MDKAKIAKLCNEIEDFACDISLQTMNDIVSAESRMIFDKAKEISAEITTLPKTNADRIRQMTDEELAGVIGFNECKDTAQGYECPAWIQPHCDGECKKHFLAWLKQEVETDDER